MIPNEFATAPIVYAVNRSYQIIVPVTTETLMWVRVGNEDFFDDVNGVLRSDCTTHRMTVPMELLDRERKYTVCYRIVRERKPYFSDTSDVMTYESSFRPIEKSPIHIYHISDAHNRIAEPVAAGKYFGEQLDLLVLNGDIPNHCGDVKNFTAIHQIASEITQGKLPVVFSRGNHDTRGIYAEKLAEHTPTDNGRSYFTFRLGSLWGLVLDCAEDKPDGNPEYGNTICCEAFRRRETAFLKEVIRNAEAEYHAEGVENRIVVVHNPFTHTPEPPFDIEQELFSEWARLLREEIKPQIMLCGHTHKNTISPIGGSIDQKGQPCPLVVASEPNRNGRFVGGAFTLRPNACLVSFTDDLGNTVDSAEILF